MYVLICKVFKNARLHNGTVVATFPYVMYLKRIN